MEKLLQYMKTINTTVVWGVPMVALILGVGFYLLFVTKGALFLHFGTVLRYTVKTIFQKQVSANGTVTPFQAVCTALAATVGTGNIVGVALAIATGGPGALFWMWVSALAGMVIKYSEVTLSVAYRTKNHRDETVGGPMYYIENAWGIKWLAILFAVFAAFASFGIGAGVQAHSLANSMKSTFGVPLWLSGAVVTTLAGLVLVGGIRRIANASQVLVPFMSALYIVGAAVVLIVNAADIPRAFSAIFKAAFTGSAAVGGFAGATVTHACRVGMARGVFTHEAGMGSAPIAHAPAFTDHPARQGLWGAFEVFFDSIVMCTVTGLVILTSDLWYSTLKISPTILCSKAFENAFAGGQYIVSVGLVLFAFATIIAWYYYGEKCVEYLFWGKQFAITFYRILYIGTVLLGSLVSLDAVWAFTDLFNGLMALPNLLALLVLSPIVAKLTHNFFRNPHCLRAHDEDFSRYLTAPKQSAIMKSKK